MNKIKCPKCGYEFPSTEEQIKQFSIEVNKAVKDREVEIKKNLELELSKSHLEEINELKTKITKLQGELNLKYKDGVIETATLEKHKI